MVYKYQEHFAGELAKSSKALDAVKQLREGA